MANISLTLYTNGFFGSVLKSPIQVGQLSANNSVTNISRLSTFKGRLAPLLWVGGWDKWWRKYKEECCIAVEGGKAVMKEYHEIVLRHSWARVKTTEAMVA
jgi:hypothetical protein